MIAWLLLIAGLLLVVFGADYLVDGASSVARRLGLSEFVIGLTIVGMGTSAPEMVVSFIGAFHGNADIALGNVVGSNIMNTLLILGLTAVILPISVTRQNRHRDIPINIVVTIILILLGLEMTIFGYGEVNELSRWDGCILLAVFIVYMIISFTSGKPDEEEEPGKQRNIWVALLMVAGGLAGLIYGGDLFVDNATIIAKDYGLSDKFIAITILAGGTSMPELATCVVAAIKKKGQLALGNIIGSNIFNILLVLGGSAVIHPISFQDFENSVLTLGGVTIPYVDLIVLFVSALALLASVYIREKNKIDRLDGALFLTIWVGYMAYLFLNL